MYIYSWPRGDKVFHRNNENHVKKWTPNNVPNSWRHKIILITFDKYYFGQRNRWSAHQTTYEYSELNFALNKKSANNFCCSLRGSKNLMLSTIFQFLLLRMLLTYSCLPTIVCAERELNILFQIIKIELSVCQFISP